MRRGRIKLLVVGAAICVAATNASFAAGSSVPYRVLNRASGCEVNVSLKSPAGSNGVLYASRTCVFPYSGARFAVAGTADGAFAPDPCDAGPVECLAAQILSSFSPGPSVELTVSLTWGSERILWLARCTDVGHRPGYLGLGSPPACQQSTVQTAWTPPAGTLLTCTVEIYSAYATSISGKGNCTSAFIPKIRRPPFIDSSATVT